MTTGRLIEGMEVSHKVRVVTVDGAPWFVAADVCKVLALRGTAVACTAAADEKGFHQVETLGGPQRMVIISEAGLFRLIMRSDKPIARPFQDWVTREVLPSIRKTGSFTLAPGETIPLPANFTDALRQHAATLIKLAEDGRKFAPLPDSGGVTADVCRVLGLDTSKVARTVGGDEKDRYLVPTLVRSGRTVPDDEKGVISIDTPGSPQRIGLS